MAVIRGNHILEGARQRADAGAGASGDMTGYGPTVNPGTANLGTPGTAFGAGTIQPGGLVIGGTKLFINTGSQAAPTWTVVGSQS